MADTNGNKIRSVTPDGYVSTLAGFSTGSADGVRFLAGFNAPFGVALDSAGAALFIADSNNQKIRRLDLASLSVTSFAGSGAAGWADGTGAAALFNNPWGLALEPATGLLWVSDSGNFRIRVVNPTSGAVSTLAGSGAVGALDGFAASAGFSAPRGLAFDGAGRAIVVDFGGHALRRVECPSSSPSPTPSPSVSAGLSASRTPSATPPAAPSVVPLYGGCALITIAGAGGPRATQRGPWARLVSAASTGWALTA